MKKTIAILSSILIAAGLKAQTIPAVRKETSPQDKINQNTVLNVSDSSKLTNRTDKITMKFGKLTNSNIKQTGKPDKITNQAIKGDLAVGDSAGKAIKITNNAQNLKITKAQKETPLKY